VLLTRECAIGPLETAGELGDRLAILGADLLLETLEGLERGAIQRHPQDSSRATLAPPLRREDAVVDWDAPGREVAGRVRGCNPWPVVCAGLRGRRVQILRAVEIAPDIPDAPRTGAPQAGEVVEASGDHLVVACGGGTLLRLLEMRFPGRSAIGAVDAVNGRLVRAGDRFTAPPE
jgi:methionyl-tRNA formyltransferase